MTPSTAEREVIPAHLTARVAPLSSALVLYSFAHRWEAEVVRVPVYSAEQAAERFEEIWQSYVTDVQLSRSQLFQEIDTQVELDKALPPRQKRLNVHWLRRELAPVTRESGNLKESKKAPVSSDTLTKLVENHLLRRDSWGVYDWQSVAALWICRRIDRERERNWLPEQVSEQEPWWWCWSQDFPTASLLPCPYPSVPVNLSNSTVLYTRWAGAGWSDDAWLKVGSLGAITFVGLIRDAHSDTPTMRLEDLEVWQHGISKQALPAFPLELEDEEQPTSPPLDASFGLADALQVLHQFQRSGLLKAPVSHVPDIRGGKGHATLQLGDGQVLQCLVTDPKGHRHAIAQDLLLRLDEKHGPFAWHFHPYSSAALLRSMPYRHLFREQANLVLKRLANQMFSGPEFDNL